MRNTQTFRQHTTMVTVPDVSLLAVPRLAAATLLKAPLLWLTCASSGHQHRTILGLHILAVMVLAV